MKALLVGPAHSFKDEDVVSSSQFYPFFDNRTALHRKLGMTFKHVNAHTFVEIEAACQDNPADVFFIRPIWKQTPQQAEQTMQRIRELNPDSIIIFLDPFDQTSSRFFSVLPYVDKIIKYQGLKDSTAYSKTYAGGTFLTDRLANRYGYNLQGWHAGSEIPKNCEHKIDTGWFITLTPRFKLRLFNALMPWSNWWVSKDIDVFCHVSYGPRGDDEWYFQHRKDTINALQKLPKHLRLSVSGDYAGESKISSKQYKRLIKCSRISVSPFGWGEITWRDYESVIYGCLLMKPSAEHIAAEPNIFIAGETYVPLKWDFSDLEEKCQYYIEHPEESDRIIRNARQAYLKYFKEAQFIEKIESLIKPSSEIKLDKVDKLAYSS